MDLGDHPFFKLIGGAVVDCITTAMAEHERRYHSGQAALPAVDVAELMRRPFEPRDGTQLLELPTLPEGATLEEQKLYSTLNKATWAIRRRGQDELVIRSWEDLDSLTDTQLLRIHGLGVKSIGLLRAWRAFQIAEPSISGQATE